MKKVWNWLKAAVCKVWTRLKMKKKWLYLAGGILTGLFAGGFFTACYAGAGISAALQYKNRAWGGRWNWLDFALVCIGAVVGYLIRLFL